MTRQRLTTSIVVILWLASTPARAANDVDEAAARVLFGEGRKLAAAGDYAGACPKFEESFRLDAGIGTGFNLADCWEHVGRTASAWGRFMGVAAAAKAAGQSEREQVARARAAALEPRLSRLVVTVDAPEEGLNIQRDAIFPVGPASWGVPVPVDPGPRTIQATAPRKKPYTVTVEIPASGETVTVPIPPLEPEPLVLRSEPALEKVTVTAPPPRSPLPALIAGAVGIAGVATAVIFGLETLSVNDQAKQICPTNLCSQSEKTQHDQLVSDARRDRSITYVGIAVAGVGLATAALLWWRPGPLRPRTAAAGIGPRLQLLDRGLATGVEVRW
jgi:hypothetical protein